ncbi:MAG: 50S ribosomal protein L35 [Alphaproteobacteria bacterium]|nr:50S ribosomal protein L35 [Alphaproteobacteria bacterium]MBU0859828.1 50S ribosomal protein L35 [Alphaproteobacteria bacterium]
MPKMKTKSAVKKRFKVTGSGHVKAKPAKMRHMQMNKPKSMKRKARKAMILDDSNQTMVIDNWMPYSGVKKGKKSPNPAERAAKKAIEAAKAVKAAAFKAVKGGK